MTLMWGAVFVAAIIFTSQPCLSAVDNPIGNGPYAFEDDEVPIMNPYLGWDSGRLTFHADGHGQITSFSISYDVTRTPNYGIASFQSLSVSTEYWEVDLLPYVQELTFPFPNRIGNFVNVLDERGNISVMTLFVPFLSARTGGTPEGAEAYECNSLVIHIADGNVSQIEPIRPTSNNICQ